MVVHRLHTTKIHREHNEATATQRALTDLRAAILTFDLKPGEPLGEDELARRLEVSRTPIREALSLLEQEGLVRRIRNRGAMVADVSLQAVLEAYEVRQHLESAAARTACAHVTDQDSAVIRSTVARMHPQPASISEKLENEEDDRRIHNVVLLVAGNALLQDVVEQSRRRTQRVMFVLPQGRYSTSIAEHEAIADALEARDADAAEVAMRRHLQRAAERLSPLWTGVQ
jgi:DNA-binding GntR family transcriptional regulator